MTLSCDNDGFIIGEKRFKELSGDVAQIDNTTQEILSVLTDTYTRQQSHAHQKDKLFDKLLDTYKLTAKTPSAILTEQVATPHHTDNTVITNTDITTQEVVGVVKLTSNTPKQHDNISDIDRKLTATPVKSQPKTQDDDKLTQALKATTDIIGALGVNSQNISPEIDALHEVKETISPALRAFTMMGRGVGHLFKKPKETPLPKAQQKHYKQTNAHNKETRRLYRLILQKLIDSSLKLLVLKGLGDNVLPALGGKKDKIKAHDKNGKNKYSKNPTNTKRGGKLGAMWLAMLAFAGGMLPFLGNDPEQANESPKQDAHHQPKSSTNFSKLADGDGTGSVLTAIATTMLNPASMPIALLAGGVAGLSLTTIIGDKIEPYLHRAGDGIYRLWQDAKAIVNTDVDKSIGTAQKAHDFSQKNILVVWELLKLATAFSIKGLVSMFDTAKQGLFSMVGYVLRGIMTLSPSFVSARLSSITQSFSDLGLHIKQGFANIGQYMTNMVNNITNTNNYMLIGSVSGNMVSTEEATKMAEYAARHAAKSTLGKCALYVNNAVRSLGYKASGHGKDVARNIINGNKDFVEVAYSADYVPQDGDIMSIDDGGEYGHVAIYNARLGKWVSDFVQHKTRGNTAAASDKSYQKIISGKAKVTIARNVHGHIPMTTQTKKAGSTNHASITAKTTNTPSDISGLIVGEPNTLLSSNTVNTHNHQSITNVEQNYDTLVAQESLSPVFRFFKMLTDLGGGLNSTSDNTVLNTQQGVVNASILPIYVNSQRNISTFIQKPLNIPQKVALPKFNLKLPLFGKSVKPKSQTTINNQKHKDRLPVHTVVGKDSFV